MIAVRDSLINSGREVCIWQTSMATEHKRRGKGHTTEESVLEIVLLHSYHFCVKRSLLFVYETLETPAIGSSFSLIPTK